MGPHSCTVRKSLNRVCPLKTDIRLSIMSRKLHIWLTGARSYRGRARPLISAEFAPGVTVMYTNCGPYEGTVTILK